MIVIDKEHHECLKIDVMEVEKIEKNLGLSRKLKKVWNMKVTAFPLVVGTLGTPANALDKLLKTVGIETKITVLIHTSRTL